MKRPRYDHKFELWFQSLQYHAQKRGYVDLIDYRNRESYREYFDDGDDVEDVIEMEIRHHRIALKKKG